jgi:hypothetical protein
MLPDHQQASSKDEMGRTSSECSGASYFFALVRSVFEHLVEYSLTSGEITRSSALIFTTLANLRDSTDLTNTQQGKVDISLGGLG